MPAKRSPSLGCQMCLGMLGGKMAYVGMSRACAMCRGPPSFPKKKSQLLISAQRAGSEGGFDIGENMGVILQFLLVTKGDFLFLTGKIEDNLCVKVLDDSSENVFHILAGPYLVLQSGSRRCHDDGTGKINSLFLHKRVVVFFLLPGDIKAEFTAFL